MIWLVWSEVEDLVPAASAQISWCSFGAGDPCSVIKCRRKLFVPCLFFFTKYFPETGRKKFVRKGGGNVKPRIRLVCRGKCGVVFCFPRTKSGGDCRWSLHCGFMDSFGLGEKKALFMHVFFLFFVIWPVIYIFFHVSWHNVKPRSHLALTCVLVYHTYRCKRSQICLRRTVIQLFKPHPGPKTFIRLLFWVKCLLWGERLWLRW